MLELFVLSGPDAGLSVTLKPGELIGRADGLALVLHDRSISRRHARLEERAGELVFVDLDSTNGMFLEDQRVSEVVLEDFLEFRVGEVLLRARLGATGGETGEHISLIEGPATRDSAQAAEGSGEPEVSFAFGGGVAKAAPKGEPEPELEIEWEEEPEAPLSEPSLREAQRAELLADLQKPKAGLFRADLSQYPGPIQALIGLVVLGVGAAIFYGIYTLVIGARS